VSFDQNVFHKKAFGLYRHFHSTEGARELSKHLMPAGITNSIGVTLLEKLPVAQLVKNFSTSYGI
jgi:hypothetical protein